MRRPFRALSSTLTAVLLAAALAAPVDGQVRYTTVTSLELGGPMGRMMGMMPGMDTDTRETTWISGSQMRTDTEDQSTLVDLAEGRFVVLDHASESYWAMTLADFRRSMEEMQEEVRTGMEGADPQGQEAGEGEGAGARMDVSLSTERTGETRTIGGFTAEQVFVTLEMDARGSPMAATTGNPEMQQGTTVVMNELWVTDEPLSDAMAEVDMHALRDAGTGAMEGMQHMFSQDPNMEVAFDHSQAAMEDLGGTTLESTTFWIFLAPDAELDREAVLAERDAGLGDAAGDAAADGAQDAAADAVRDMGRRLGGLFGGGDKEEEAEETAPPTQVIFMQMLTRLEDVERGPIPDSTFEIPEGYTERAMPGLESGSEG